MENRDNLLGVVATFYKWRKKILGLSLIAGIGSLILSFGFLDDYYQSTTVFYVASPDLFKPEQVFGTSQKDMEYYGTDDDVDRILTIAQGPELEDYLIKRFNLYKHYKIDSTKEKSPFKVAERLRSLYEVKKTKRNAIELSLEDTDKKLASEIANAARDKVDEIAQRLIRQSQANVMKSYETNFREKNKIIKEIGDTLNRMRLAYGVYDLEKQGEAIATHTANAKASLLRNQAKLEDLVASGVSKDSISITRANLQGDKEDFKESQLNLKRYGDGMNGVALYTQLYKKERDQLSLDKERYLQMQTSYQSNISALHLVSPADLPIVKSRPKRSMIFLGALLSAFIFSSLAALLLDSYKDVNWKELIKEH
jgi:tyrosine-protein kinase Etk/Wzc